VTSLVFDTTALSHFARADRTETLQAAVASDEPVLLAEVAAELARSAVGYPIARKRCDAIGNRESLAVHGSLWLLIRGFRGRNV
jgi:hypothetical protein